MSDNTNTLPASARIPSTKQLLFMRYFTAILIDLAVLNLFDEYWEHVVVDSFTISLIAALLLQVLLKFTLALEHLVADFFNARSGGLAKFMRYFSAWAILFGSKFVILEIVNRAFGKDVYFGGPMHGVLAFIAVVVVMLVAEEVIVRFYRWLGGVSDSTADFWSQLTRVTAALSGLPKSRSKSGLLAVSTFR